MGPNRKIKLGRKSSFTGKKKYAEPECMHEKYNNGANLTEEERRLLAEFRTKVEDVIHPNHDDNCLLRFLKAKSFELDEAEKLLRLDINYRKFLRVENILEEYQLPEVNLKYHITGFLGFDKEGSPIRILNLGYVDTKGFIQALSTIELIKVFLWFMEKDLQCVRNENKRTGRNASQHLYIINLENFSMNFLLYKPAFDCGMLGLKLFQEHFHDITKTVYIINAPNFFPAAFKMIKPVIQEELQQKIKVYGSNDNWKEVLLKQINADVLPVFLGGQRLDCNNDPRCSAIVGYGGEIPETYTDCSDLFLDPDDPDVETAIVPAGSFINIRLPVEEVGSVVEWHIHARDNDVGIAVFYEPPTLGFETPRTRRKRNDKFMQELEQLCPVIRSQCHIRPEIGYATAWKSGVYIMHFDNTYSWMNSKQVLYKIQIKPPGSKVDEELNFHNGHINNGTKNLVSTSKQNTKFK